MWTLTAFSGYSQCHVKVEAYRLLAAADSCYAENAYPSAIQYYHQFKEESSIHRNLDYKIALCYRKLGKKDSVRKYLTSGLNNGVRYSFLKQVHKDPLISWLGDKSLLKILEKNTREYVFSDSLCQFPAVREELLRRKVLDQEIRSMPREDMSKNWEKQKRYDEQNRQYLDSLLKAGIFPGFREVGKAGSTAAWLLVQHADQDTAFQWEVYPFFCKALKQGNFSYSNFALLTDRLHVHRYGTQIFGTQLQPVKAEGIERLSPKPIQDMEMVDLRRKYFKLPPLQFYLDDMNKTH